MKRTIKVSTRGQVVIPVEIRRQLDIDRHSRLELEVEGDEIVLRPIQPEDWRDFRGFLADGPSLTEALENERETERALDASRLESK